MNTEKQASAKALYFQTSLSNTQICEILNIPRRTFHHWIRENNWDRLRQSSAIMPSFLAEHCYHMFARLSEHVLSEDRIMQPVTHKEADTLHKLVLTANKMKNRATLNENLEMLGFFMESVSKESPEMATAITPFVEKFIAKRAAVNINQLTPDYFNELGLIPRKQKTQEEIKETQLDIQDIMDWTSKDIPIADIEQFRSKVDPISSGSNAAPTEPVLSAAEGPTNPPTDYFNAKKTAAPLESKLVENDMLDVTHATSPSPSEFAQAEERSSGERSPAQDLQHVNDNEARTRNTAAKPARPLTDYELEKQELDRTLEKYRDHTGHIDFEKLLEDTLADYQDDQTNKAA